MVKGHDEGATEVRRASSTDPQESHKSLFDFYIWPSLTARILPLRHISAAVLDNISVRFPKQLFALLHREYATVLFLTDAVSSSTEQIELALTLFNFPVVKNSRTGWTRKSEQKWPNVRVLRPRRDRDVSGESSEWSQRMVASVAIWLTWEISWQQVKRSRCIVGNVLLAQCFCCKVYLWFLNVRRLNLHRPLSFRF